MSTLFPYDLLFRDFFKSELDFQPATQAKFTHPVDIFENSHGLHFDIACTGLSKEDVEINIEGDVLRVSYNKPQDEECCETNDCAYIHRGVAKRSFNLGYKIAPKFNLSKAEAMMENGLLGIRIPLADEAKPKTIQIK